MNKKLIYTLSGICFVLYCIAFSNLYSLSEEKFEYYLSLYSYSYTYLPNEDISIEINGQIRGKLNEISEKNVYLKIYKLNDIDIEKLSVEKIQNIIQKKPPIKKLSKKLVFKPQRHNWHYANTTIKTSLDEYGNYLIVGKFGDKISYITINITKIGIITKSTRDKILVFASELKKGTPIANADVILYSQGKKIASLLTNRDGLAVITSKTADIDLSKYKEMLIKVQNKNDRANTKIYLHDRDYEEFKAYIYTDRPIYRPAQVVYFKGILRMKKNDKLNPIQNEEVQIIVKDSKHQEIYKKNLKTNLYGSISDNLILGEEPPLGTYNIRVNYKNYSQYSSFKVEEYRKPEYEIQISSDKKNYFQNEEINFEISAKYYFGAPVCDNEFSYEIRRSYYYPYYYYEWLEEDIYPRYYGEGDVITSGSGKTDKEGKAKIKFTAPKIDYNAIYSIIVRMTDSSNREVTGTYTVKVTKGAFYLTVNTEKYVYSVKEKVKVKIKAQDYDEMPVSTNVYLKIKRRVYDKNYNSIEKEIIEDKVKTDNNGIAYYEFIPDAEGHFEIEASAFDERENRILSFAYFYSTSSERYNWYSSGNLEIITDKKSYNIGDTAKIIVNCPYKDTSGLFTLEGEKIYFEKVLNFKDNLQIIELKIKKNYSPNVFLNFCLYYEKNFYRTDKKLIVPSKTQFLNIKLTSDKEQYEPREILKYKIKVEDYKNNPVSAELSLSVVDESIYALAQEQVPNIQKFFYKERYNRVRTYNSLWQRGEYGYNMVMAEKSLLSKSVKLDVRKKEKVREGEYVQPEFVRSYFPDTCYFNPEIITDENGSAEVNISLPDNLTTWRATTKGVTLDTKVGEVTDKIIVKKKLLARLITPRFILERDKLKISAIVHNYLDKEKEVLVKLEVRGVNLLSSKESKIFVPKDNSNKIDFEISAKKSGTAKFKLTALTDEVSDAVELKIPVLPHGTEKFSAIAGDTQKSISEEIKLPENINKNSAHLRIILSPTLSSSILSTLEYLAGYPYGCVEQTMSRFLPTLIVSRTLQELDIYNEKLQKELPDMVKKGLERLYNFHRSDGGWGWWKNDTSHPYITAYVVYGLNLAKNTGYNVNENILNRGIDWLKSNYNSDKTKNDINVKAYILYVLSETNSASKKDAENLYKQKDKLNNYAKALFCLTLKNLNMHNEAKELIKIIENNANATATTAFWQSDEDSFGWTRSDIETTAWSLLSLIKIKPESKLISKAVRFLSISKQGNHWHSTKDTAVCLFALTDYLKTSNEISPDYKINVHLNDKFLKEIRFTKQDLGKQGQEIIIKGFDLNSGKNKIKFEKEGEGKLYYSLYLKYYTDEEGIKSQDAGFKIKREYSFRQQKAENRKQNYVNSGDLIDVKLTITSDSDYEYVIIEDPKPAGCEVVDELQGGYKYGHWRYLFSQREVRDEKVAYFITYLPKGTHTLNYVLRAETPGEFHTMPTKAQLMYIPEIGGNGDEDYIKIAEKKL